MALVREAESLLGHEIGEHGWGRSELGSHVTLLFCDNKGAITMSLHPANKPATRHMMMHGF